MMTEADTDGDGQISWPEFLEFIHKMRRSSKESTLGSTIQKARINTNPSNAVALGDLARTTEAMETTVFEISRCDDEALVPTIRGVLEVRVCCAYFICTFLRILFY